MFSGLAAAYLRALSSRPLLTNACTGAVIAAVGDAACQIALVPSAPSSTPSSEATSLLSRVQAIDWRRTAEMAAIRSCFMGPFLTVYFPWLAARAPGTTARAVATRLAIDQLVGAPFTISVTFLLVSTLHGDPAAALPRIREQLLPSLAVSACYWPVVHSVNFTRVPVRHQPLTTHFAALFWQAYLSYASYHSLKADVPHSPNGEVPPLAAPVAATTRVTSHNLPVAVLAPADR